MGYCKVSEIGGKATIVDVRAVRALIDARLPYGLYRRQHTITFKDVAFADYSEALYVNLGLPFVRDKFDGASFSYTVRGSTSTIAMGSALWLYAIDRRQFGVPMTVRLYDAIKAGGGVLRITADIGWSSLETRDSGEAIAAGECYLSGNDVVEQTEDGVLAAETEVIVPHPMLNRLAIAKGRELLQAINPTKDGRRGRDLMSEFEEYVQWLS